ncbi:MAG: hypothetical protein ABIJ92_00760 [Candidatus Aenigmatarchaeota archaeon]
MGFWLRSADDGSEGLSVLEIVGVAIIAGIVLVAAISVPIIIFSPKINNQRNKTI